MVPLGISRELRFDCPYVGETAIVTDYANLASAGRLHQCDQENQRIHPTAFVDDRVCELGSCIIGAPYTNFFSFRLDFGTSGCVPIGAHGRDKAGCQ